MKLLIATPLYPPDIGGPATHTLFLERELPTLGIDTRVASFGRVRHLPPGIRHAAYFFQLLLAGRGVDAILAQDTVSVGFPALIVARVLRKLFLVRVPGDHAWEQGRQRFDVCESLDDFQLKRYGLRVEFLRRIARAVVNGADAVIAPSAYFGRIVAGWMKNPSRLRVIYNGIGAAPALRKPERTPRHPFMVSVGRLVPWKGFDTLIDLLPELPEWSLVIVGDGPLRNHLASRAKERNVSERVQFAGSVSRGEVFGWYGEADAFVFATGFESFSYQVAEALQAGVPVIAADIGSTPELIATGKEGVLFAPGDREALKAAVLSVPAHPDAWRSRVAAGREKAARFSAATTAKQFAELIRSLQS